MWLGTLPVLRPHSSCSTNSLLPRTSPPRQFALRCGYHECGHQSFSPSKVLNDTTGWICHSALLVPYFSWKISHGKHHKATGNMERDMVFVPKTREAYATRIGRFVHELDELTEEAPIATLLHSLGQQLAGWPMYLFGNVTLALTTSTQAALFTKPRTPNSSFSVMVSPTWLSGTSPPTSG